MDRPVWSSATAPAALLDAGAPPAGRLATAGYCAYCRHRNTFKSIKQSMVILLHYLMVRKTAPPPAAAAIAAPQPPTRRQRTTLRMRLVFGGHFWQGIKVGRGLSLQFSGELANVLCIIQSVASYALLLLHCITGWTVNDVFLPPFLKSPGWLGQNLKFLYL